MRKRVCEGSKKSEIIEMCRICVIDTYKSHLYKYIHNTQENTYTYTHIYMDSEQHVRQNIKYYVTYVLKGIIKKL